MPRATNSGRLIEPGRSCISGTGESEPPGREIAKALNGAVVSDKAGDRILVPLPTGIYDVERYPFRPVRQRAPYSDELGAYGDCVLITYRDRLPAKYRT